MVPQGSGFGRLGFRALLFRKLLLFSNKACKIIAETNSKQLWHLQLCGGINPENKRYLDSQTAVNPKPCSTTPQHLNREQLSPALQQVFSELPPPLPPLPATLLSLCFEGVWLQVYGSSSGFFVLPRTGYHVKSVCLGFSGTVSDIWGFRILCLGITGLP